MSSRVLLLAIALSLVGCKKKQAPMDPLVAEVHDGLKKFRNRMCECADIQCADRTQAELGGWIMSNKDRFTEVDAKSTPAQIAAAKQLSAEHNACAAKLAKQPR